jgi:hypothetical protein
VAITDLAEVAVEYTDTTRNSTYVTTHGFQAIDTTSTRDQLADAFKTAMVKSTAGGLLFPVTNNINSTRLTVRDVKPGTGALVERNYAAVTGGSGGDPLPPQDACVFSLRTTLAGRSFRGRFYLPSLQETGQSSGKFDSSQLAILQAVAANLLAVFGPTGTDTKWQLVVISREAAGVPRVPPIGTPVTTILVRDIVYTQRRRTVGRGS